MRKPSRGAVAEEAREFLRAMLAAGPMKSTELLAAAKDAGHSEGIIKCARAELGIKADKGRGTRGKWFLRLPT